MSTVVLRKPEGRRRPTVELYAAEDSTTTAQQDSVLKMLYNTDPKAPFPDANVTFFNPGTVIDHAIWAASRAADAARAVGRAISSGNSRPRRRATGGALGIPNSDVRNNAH